MDAIILIILFAVALIAVPVWLTKKKEPAKTSPTPEQAHTPQSSKTYSPVYLARLAEVKRQAEARGDTATVQAVLNMTYDGPLPTMKPDGGFTDLQSTILTYNIVGINFRRGLSNYIGDFIGYIQPEPKNQYDPNAISIHHSDGKHLGYIPADYTDAVRDLHIPFPISVWGVIEEDYDYDDNRRYYRGTIYIEVQPKVYPSNL